MYSLTYDVWNKIIDEIIAVHAPLFDAMQESAESQKITKEIVDELKADGTKAVKKGQWQFLLSIELYGDDIEGFNIALLSAESLEAFEEVEMGILERSGVHFRDISGFEAEFGTDLMDDVIERIEERYNISSEVGSDEIVFQMVVFDSEDIDNSQNSKKTWL